MSKKLSQQYAVKALFLDEIHFLKNFEAALKQIFDFLDLRVIFTSSVALSLYESAHDLSRRVRLRHLYPFSFGEFLDFKGHAKLGRLSFRDIADKRWTNEYERWNYLFDEYLQGGLFPFALEEPEALPVLSAILEKVITRDIPTVANLRTDEIEALRKLIRFVGKATSEGINYSSISRNVGITKYKAEQYVHLLKKSFVLNPVLPAGTNVLREPKVLMWTPLRLLYKSYEDTVGELREDFVAQALKIRCTSLQYLKSPRGEKTSDFLVEENGKQIVVEVGGKGRGKRQFKGFHAEEKIILGPGDETQGFKRPLVLLGYW